MALAYGIESLYCGNLQQLPYDIDRS
jgi:hypothetical protein